MWYPDTKMENYNLSPVKLTLTGLATAITCILSPLSLMVPFSPVPVSLGLFAILLSVCLLEAHMSLLSYLMYLLLGMVGLPVFSGFTGGIGVVLGPTGGYLLGYLFLPLCTIPVCRRKNMPLKCMLPGLIIGLLLCYLCGTLWLSLQTKISFSQAVIIGAIPYIPFDIIKLCLAYVTAKTIRNRLRKAGLS